MALTQRLPLRQWIPWTGSWPNGCRWTSSGPRGMNKKERQNEIDKLNSRRGWFSHKLRNKRGWFRCWPRQDDPHPCQNHPFVLPGWPGTSSRKGSTIWMPSGHLWGNSQSWRMAREHWTIFLWSSLSGAGLTAMAAMAADQQADYDAVRAELLREYHITTETFRRRTFDTPIDSTNPDTWLSKHRQHFQQWLLSSPLDSEATMQMEVTLWRLPKWLETQMRNLNLRSFKELSEAIVRHLANQTRREMGVPRPPEKTNERGDSDLRLPSDLYSLGRDWIKLETDTH